MRHLVPWSGRSGGVALRNSVPLGITSWISDGPAFTTGPHKGKTSNAALRRRPQTCTPGNMSNFVSSSLYTVVVPLSCRHVQARTTGGIPDTGAIEHSTDTVTSIASSSRAKRFHRYYTGKRHVLHQHYRETPVLLVQQYSNFSCFSFLFLIIWFDLFCCVLVPSTLAFHLLCLD